MTRNSAALAQAVRVNIDILMYWGGGGHRGDARSPAIPTVTEPRQEHRVPGLDRPGTGLDREPRPQHHRTTYNGHEAPSGFDTHSADTVTHTRERRLLHIRNRRCRCRRFSSSSLERGREGLGPGPG